MSYTLPKQKIFYKSENVKFNKKEFVEKFGNITINEPITEEFASAICYGINNYSSVSKNYIELLKTTQSLRLKIEDKMFQIASIFHEILMLQYQNQDEYKDNPELLNANISILNLKLNGVKNDKMIYEYFSQMGIVLNTDGCGFVNDAVIVKTSKYCICYDYSNHMLNIPTKREFKAKYLITAKTEKEKTILKQICYLMREIMTISYDSYFKMIRECEYSYTESDYYYDFATWYAIVKNTGYSETSSSRHHIFSSTLNNIVGLMFVYNLTHLLKYYLNQHPITDIDKLYPYYIPNEIIHEGITITQITNNQTNYLFDLMFTCHKDPIEFFKYIWNESLIIEHRLFSNKCDKNVITTLNKNIYHILLSFAKHGSYCCLTYLLDNHNNHTFNIYDFESLDVIFDGLKNSGKKGFLNTFECLYELYKYVLSQNYSNFEYNKHLNSFITGEKNTTLVVNVINGLINDNTHTRGHNIIKFLIDKKHSFQFIEQSEINYNTKFNTCLLENNIYNIIREKRIDVYNTIYNKIYEEKPESLLKALKTNLESIVVSMITIGIPINKCFEILRKSHETNEEALIIINALENKKI